MRPLWAALLAITLPLWLPFYLVLVVLFFAAMLTACGMSALTRRYRDARMAQRTQFAGRKMSWEDVERRAAKGGTLIEDWTTVGWIAARVWWTDDVVAALPDPFEADDPWPLAAEPAYRAAIKMYASPDSPRIRLVAIAHGGRACRKLEQRIARLRERFPAAGYVKLCSGAAACAERHPPPAVDHQASF